MRIADLGCSSGPNALALVSIAVEAIDNHCVQLKQPPPEVCVLLNDLPGNDFNTVVKSLVTLPQSNKDVAVTVGIAPGSFYERLFTSGSLHLFCSSNSLNWLSKGVIDKAKFDSFYVPVYGPSDEELREIVEKEGSFFISEMQVHDFTWSLDNALLTTSWYTNQMRAAFEPIVVHHFGEVMDEFVKTAERRWSVEGSLQDEVARYTRAQLAISLTKKA